MSRSVERLQKLAAKFEYKLNKFAQEVPLKDEGTTEDLYAFQNFIESSFSSKDKNDIANKIVNSTDADVNSLSISLYVKDRKLTPEAMVNNAPNAAANKIVFDAVNPKISTKISEFPNGSSFKGWIKYPK